LPRKRVDARRAIRWPAPRGGRKRRRSKIYRGGSMRCVLPLLVVLAVAGCTEATASRIDNRTFKIEGPGVPGGSSAPDQRMASRLCPDGYRVLSEVERRNTPDGYSDEPGVYTNWIIRCL
jgi:hypothetical protein